MKHLAIFVFLLSSTSAQATAFTLGDGLTWRGICSGVHEGMDSQSAIASCTMLLLGYQAGAVEQSRLNDNPVSLCRSFNPNTLPKEFVAFVNSNKKFQEMDVLDVLLEFTKGNACGI
ncbi:hypothetical protein MIB92_05595 [Aestuariirhabdus sp. Z084]|uniref:hypothetical protein n=1 Tax=Aestuariirhabdus haliotis TaxID=2918751 RepID=UPI00201B3F17|nr:hypothetical protein [Aestuariirhabdus haliotis]MCL6415116.1 hypothetical protein [Aestuariirhabdus haliotis]MCL6419048.1 hypothetical protein [Aestuariirhabdus haliotis]